MLFWCNLIEKDLLCNCVWIFMLLVWMLLRWCVMLRNFLWKVWLRSCLLNLFVCVCCRLMVVCFVLICIWLMCVRVVKLIVVLWLLLCGVKCCFLLSVNVWCWNGLRCWCWWLVIMCLMLFGKLWSCILLMRNCLICWCWLWWLICGIVLWLCFVRCLSKELMMICFLCFCVVLYVGFVFVVVLLVGVYVYDVGDSVYVIM